MMKKHILLLSCIVSVVLFSCNTQPVGMLGAEGKIVMRFELDSAGEIKDEIVKQQLITLAKDISKNADRLTLTAYSEQTGSDEKNLQIAQEMSYAAKRVMLLNAERAYYNVGVNAVGYADPVNPSNPADIQNRRIEFTYLK
jgi:outer membrane protein OmpA-like peptidoglycan-associated protein